MRRSSRVSRPSGARLAAISELWRVQPRTTGISACAVGLESGSVAARARATTIARRAGRTPATGRRPVACLCGAPSAVARTVCAAVEPFMCSPPGAAVQGVAAQLTICGVRLSSGSRPGLTRIFRALQCLKIHGGRYPPIWPLRSPQAPLPCLAPASGLAWGCSGHIAPERAALGSGR